LQEYLLLNKVVVEVIVTLGAAGATLSEAALAWLDLEGDLRLHRASSYAHLLGMGAVGEAAYAMIMQAFESRKAIGLTMLHCAALMLDPRPDLCRKASQYIGCVEDNNLGNTPVVRKAVGALGVLAKVVRGTKKDGSIRNEREATTVLCKQMQAWLEVRPKLVTQWLAIKLLLRAQASVLTSALSKTGACLQVSPAHTRDSLGIKGAELKAFVNSEHPSFFWQLHVDPCLLLREAAMRLFTLVASALGVKRLWSGARRTLTDTRRSMTSARLAQLLLVVMNPNLINDQALFERLGVEGSASLAMDFDCMYEEILLMDEEDLVAALAEQGRQNEDMGSDALSDAYAEEPEQVVDPNEVDWDD
jgi:hypothetical protein